MRNGLFSSGAERAARIEGVWRQRAKLDGRSRLSGRFRFPGVGLDAVFAKNGKGQFDQVT